MRLDEKAVSRSQQHLFGAALRAKREGRPTFPEAQRLADELSEKQLRDFAKTKHEGLPDRVPKKKRKRRDESYRPGVTRADGTVKAFSEWFRELESALDEGEEQPGDEEGIDGPGMNRDEAMTVALNELGLLTKSELDPNADRDAIAAALPVKLDLVRARAKASSRLQEIAAENPAVQRVLADKNATVQDLVLAMASSGEDDQAGPPGAREARRSPMGSREPVGFDIDGRPAQGQDQPDPFAAL